MRSNSKPRELPVPFAPRIYYFHPSLAGDLSTWKGHFERCRDLGFDHILMAPLFAPGGDSDIFLTRSHEHGNPAFGDLGRVDDVLAGLAGQCRDNRLQLLSDIVVGRFAPDADLVLSNPGWFQIKHAGGDRVDPRAALNVPDAAYPRWEDAGIIRDLSDWWVERLLRLGRAGVSGFRCMEPHLVPKETWREIISRVREQIPDCRFLAATAGLDWDDITRLRGAGFDAAFSSLPWWDGRSEWMVEEYELLRSVGAVIASPEAPYGPRLSGRYDDAAELPRVYRHQLRRAAAIGNGLMVPMGFEFAAADTLERSPAKNGATAPHRGNVDLSEEIREGNRLCSQLAALTGELRSLAEPDRAVAALLRFAAFGERQTASPVLILLNSDFQREQQIPISLQPLPPTAGASLSVCDVVSADRDSQPMLDPGEVRILYARQNAPVKVRRQEVRPAALGAAPRIVVDAVSPSIDGGRYAAKSIVGQSVIVEADVFADGHDVLVVDCLWRAVDAREWLAEPMQPIGNDRWRAGFVPDRVGRYEFTLEAWIDGYASLCRDIEAKRAAKSDVSVEISEAQNLLKKTSERTENGASTVMQSALEWLNDAAPDAAADILLSSDLREVMRETQQRAFRVRREPTWPLDVERPRAGFGAWYELFPRSAAPIPGRHGTFADVILRLPALRDMGFDVLYLPPIHPIGKTNRKGKNNALHAGPDDPGSPYAIGGEEGGHDAIHPALGGIDDFKALRDAAEAHGMEIALDFAIQCSPDHPWLKAHPEWFKWRPDGSVRYAENPPKKYEDIVNVDFYAKDAIPDLWQALRDIVLFWVGEGIRIFRVDNPHTKPLPFWEWLIAQVRARQPEVIFLSEAFTHPKMMYRLAKIGFSQSYTYFTWRNSKQELIDYFTELTTSDTRNYFWPNLFVNTPDINPYFLQTAGRTGFLIRAALAATLSGLWGIYSGFELCEAAPLPGREEYLDSEKYEVRTRDFAAPGNIIAEISKLNRIRKNNPALHSHLGLRFYPAYNDQVILYGKPLPAGSQMILVAVSLDPFNDQETTFEIPLWEWNLPDGGTLEARDLMRDISFTWTGKLQRVRLTPAEPFAIWRIAPRREY